MTEDQMFLLRVAHRARRARRTRARWAVFYALVAAGLGLGLGTVASRAAEPPVAAGGVRVQPRTIPATKWVRRTVERYVRHRVPRLLQNCEQRRCAVFTRDGNFQATMLRLADGRWRILTISGPPFKATQ